MLLPIMEREVKKLLNAQIIVPLRYSEWVANLVPVRKKIGEMRLCVDFRNLNRSSKKENYPFPKMEHILQRVTCASRISMIVDFLDTLRSLSCLKTEKRQPSPLLGAHSCMPKFPLD
jgi:hypothetical protein